MFCIKCGTQIPPDGRFCNRCGTPVYNQNPQTPPFEQPMAAPVGGIDNVPPAPPYAPVYAQGQPYGPPPVKKSKKKALIIASASAVAILALAAVLIFVVFAQAAGWPLSGDTLQTKFVNENFEVFALIYEDEPQLDTEVMLKQPFEYMITQSITGMSGFDMQSEIAFAYDELTLGMLSSQNDTTTKLLLIEDTLYIGTVYDYFGYEYEHTVGLKFDTKADLSKPMPLEDRINALMSELEIDIDTKKLAEMFFNSISEDCFDKNDMRTTLTLRGEDLAQTLRTFSDKLKDERVIDDAFGNIIEKFSGVRMNLSSALALITPQLARADFELVWTVKYDNGKPNRIEMSASAGREHAFDLSVETQRRADDKNVRFELFAPGYYENTNLNFDFSWQTKDSKTVFKADLALNETTMTMSGTIDMSEYGYTMLMDMHIPDYDETVTSKLVVSLSPGQPRRAVLDDERFQINTDEAIIIDLGDMTSLFEQAMF